MTKYVSNKVPNKKKKGGTTSQDELFSLELENINITVKDSIFDKSSGSQNDVINLKRTLEIIERKKNSKINDKKKKTQNHKFESKNTKGDRK